MNVRLASICATLVIGLLLAGCSSNNSTAVTLTITPTAATVLLGTSVQFIPSLIGSSNAVQWSVNGVVGGNATVGTIDASGLYTAPAVRPVSASGVAVPIIFAVANAAVPNSGSTGSVIELQAGFNLAGFVAGNTITIANNSQAGWDGSFVIEASGVLSNGNFGVQIATPAGPPASGLGGTATATPNVTITAQVEGTSVTASATVSLDSGIRVSLSEPTCTIGTNETFSFTALVSGSSNQTVTWSVSGVGTIDPNTGIYTAPSTTGTATITATSVVDPTETATATVTVAAAADPGVTALSPQTGALGAASQDVYLSGSNFICTTAVLVNGTPLPATSVSSVSSSSLLVVLPDAVLSTLPASGSTSVTLTFSAERQNGTPQNCSPTTACQLTLSPVRPALVASSPDSIQSTSGSFSVTLDGGYFGTTNTAAGVSGNPVVQVQFNGATVASPQFLNSDRELVATVPAGSTPAAGLYPITVTNTVSCPPGGTLPCGTGSPNGSIAAANLAVQPTISSTPLSTFATVGTMPTAVAINTAMGTAVVANQASNDVTILSLGTIGSPSVTISTPSLCTGSLGAASGSCVASVPMSVAVDNINNFALVANSSSTSPTLAVVNLNTATVTALLTFPSGDPMVGKSFSLSPVAVGINPVSRRALVAFTANQIAGTGSNAGAILDLDLLEKTSGLVSLPPAVINVVNLNNAATPHIAVSPKLNWALVTPGGGGALSIVDLGRQTTNQLTTLTCTPGSASTSPSVVIVNTATTLGLLAGQPVLVTGVSPPAFNGIFTATAVSNTSFQYFAQAPCPSSATSGAGGTASYALPVASIATDPNVRGVSINDETQKALLAEPTANVPAFVFNILDQTSSLVNGLPSVLSNVATAMNPLTNLGLSVNSGDEVSVVNPVAPAVVTSFAVGTSPLVDVAVDPVADTALVVSQGDNTVRLLSLAALRSAPQIIQASFAPVGSGQSSSQVTITSSLSAGAVAPNQTVTLIGTFPGTPVPRLDGNCSSAFVGSPTIIGGRVMMATISGAFLAANGPRLYALDVVDSCATPSAFSNVARLQVIQAVNLVTSNCANPAPQGVAIDATHNVAVVTEPGCNDVSMVRLANSPGFPLGTGYGAAPELAVGANPQGVGVYPQAGLAVVADTNSNAASIVDIVNDDVPTAVSTDPLPTGVAVNLGTGYAVVTANGASLADSFLVSTTAQTPTTIGVQQGPTGVAVDPKGGVAVVANSSSNTASVVDLATNTATFTSNSITFPQGVAFDPITDTFLVTSGASNQVVLLNPNTGSSIPIRVGIDPSSVAYNFESGTLVTANNLSGTVSVVDFIDQTVRGVFSLRSSTQFAVDIHPQTNLAVVADTADNQLLLVPLPH